MSHPTITNEVARLRSEEKIARGLAAHARAGEMNDVESRSARFTRKRRLWQFARCAIYGSARSTSAAS